MINVWPAENSHFDIVIIGSGPGGQRAAVQSAKLGKKVLIVEKDSLGGACLHKGTIPSKTLREAAMKCDALDPHIAEKVMKNAHDIIGAERELIERQLTRNKVEICYGMASFIDPQTILIRSVEGQTKVKTSFVIIATGSRPHRPTIFDFSHPSIFDSDTILNLKRQPRHMAVFGSGVVGCEYASIFARLGVKITLFDKRPTLLKGVDEEIMQILHTQFEKNGITPVLDCETLKIIPHSEKLIEVSTTKGDFDFDVLLCCMGREGNVESLHLENAGITANSRGVISVNSSYQTSVSHIYAVGDVQGSPQLATSSSEQGRIAAASAFAHYSGKFPETFPYGIYTIPETSSVGLDEAMAKERGIKVIVGRARYSELARGRIIGDDTGFLKLIFCAETAKLIGTHCIGTQATELIHIGQTAIALGADLDFFLNNVFNYPTLAEAYKVAGYNAFNQMQNFKREQHKAG